MLVLLNLGLRGLVLASKFLVIFVLAFYLKPSEVALYGLVAASVGYALYAAGFEFYNYSIREVIAAGPSGKWVCMKNQAVFFVASYLVVFPCLLVIFATGLLPWHVAGFFYVLLVTEHLSQEVSRLLVVSSRQLVASLLLFARAGTWPLAVTALFALLPHARNLEMVLIIWTFCSGAGCLAGIAVLFRDKGVCIPAGIDWAWIGRGIRVALPFLLATLALRGIFTVDRYWVEGVSSELLAASYMLYMSMANALLSFLDAGVFVFFYPRMVEAFRQADRPGFQTAMASMLKRTLLASLLVPLMILALFPMAMSLIGRAEYLGHMPLFCIVMVAVALFCIGMVPHYGLYAMARDRHILIAHATACLVFIAACLLLSGPFGGYGIGMALLAAFLYLLVYKTSAYLFLKEKTWLNLANKGKNINV